MRRQVALALALAGCAPPAGDDPLAVGRRYVADPAVGRAALEASIVDSTNDYSRLRLESYDAWATLPEPARRVAWVTPGQAPADWFTLPADLPADPDAVRDQGELAFRAWPVQVDSALEAALDDPAAAAAAGLPTDAAGRLPLIWVQGPTGPLLACTCATCHRLDGAATFDERALHTGRPSQGAGRLDVTADGLDNPTTITDLRPVRRQTHLHHAATLRNSLAGLAVRIETLLITSAHAQHRPPRAIAFALAWYLWTLADAQPPVPGGPGADVFARTCGGCHAGPDLAGPPVPLDALAPLSPAARAIGASPDRGTGTWRVPSLRGVGTRRPLLASGEVPDLDALLDPTRGGPHPFGQTLAADDRATLLAWLRRL
ncbi:MAG: hypothetical protein H6706_19265 [Myxococcales bacterium]|nr:hypothetical protein [Myxococcales bacterium]